MKRTIVLTILVIVFASVFVLGLVPNLQAGEDEECSDASLDGTYGYYGFGTVVPDDTPIRSIARFTFDGQGNYSNSFTINDNGTVTRGAASATYTVNPDCTGTILGGQGQPLFDLVLVDGGKEFYAVRVDPATRVLTGIAKKQSSGHEKKHDKKE